MTDEETGTEESAPRRPRRRRRRILLPIILTLSVLLVGSAAAVGLYALKVEQSLIDNLTRDDESLPEDDDPDRPDAPTPEPGANGPLNYLLLGSDSRDPKNADGEGRSDTIMIAHLDADRQNAYLISFPRDMWVDVPGHGEAKINAAYSLGGSKLAVRTVEELIGTRIDHVVMADFEGFISLTEDLGGVTIHNEHYSKSHGYEYPEGEITISGEEALWYVRERKQLPNGDLDRAERQRIVLKAILEKGMSRSVMADPAKFTRFISGVAKHLTVDGSLSNEEIRQVGLSLRLTGEDVELLQAPISGFGTSPNGESIDIVNEEQLAEMSKALKKDDLDSYLEKYPPENE
ncbi:MAG: LCP family protein [Propionibacteriaceae bacterium]